MAMPSAPNQFDHIVHFSRPHTGGVQFLLCCGSVPFLSRNIVDGLFRNLGERADRNVIGELQVETCGSDTLTGLPDS
jgi:hypothetical protein